MNCIHRSTHIGALKSGCYSCNVYQCNKYNIHCTINTPRVQEGRILDRKGKDTDIYFKDHRICKDCIANNEHQ